MIESSRVPAIALPIVAIVLIAVYCAAFYPGAMGFDAAYQWWQARGGETTNIHGVGMTWLWRLGNFLANGPAPIFVIQLALFWIGAVLIVAPLQLSLAARAAVLFVVGMCPIYLTVFSSVVSDAMLAAVLCCAAGVMFSRRLGIMRFVISIVLLIVALLLRKNAIFAVLPLLTYLIYVSMSARWKSETFAKSFVASIAIVLVMQVGVSLADRTVDRRVTIFAGTALWDLAAISIATGNVLIPEDSHGPGMTVDDIRQAFVPYANTTLFAKTHAGMRQPFLTPKDPRNEEIRDAWIDSIIAHPGDYAWHRLRLTRYLFGDKRDDMPRELVYFPDEYHYRDNPEIASNVSALHGAAVRLFETLRATTWLAAWPYVLIALTSLGFAWKRRESLSAQAAIALSISGLSYAAPLPIIAPSAELRYLGWTCFSALLSAALAWSARRKYPHASEK